MKNKFSIFLLLTLLIVSLTACTRNSNQSNNSSTSTSTSSFPEIQINETKLKIEVADTELEREEGLMNRTSMPQDQGMIFIFDSEQVITFWMKNTLIPLDIIFINSNGEIVNIAKNTKVNQTTELYSSERPMLYAIEVNAGWTTSNNVKIGDIVDLSNIK